MGIYQQKPLWLLGMVVIRGFTYSFACLPLLGCFISFAARSSLKLSTRYLVVLMCVITALSAVVAFNSYRVFLSPSPGSTVFELVLFSVLSLLYSIVAIF